MTSRPPSSAPHAGRKAAFLLRQPLRVRGFREPLADGLALTMIWIPPGRFWMGSPKDEPERDAPEGPQHLVQLAGFFMAQTPITQAQWRAVARWTPPKGERWQQELDPAPSFFQQESLRKYGTPESLALLEGERNTDQRPVEHVSWDDAMEFSRRLNKRLGPSAGRTYTLPSEAQWEYACRAGTSTPFAFGETLTAELANYRATETYGNGAKGEWRKQTTPVGMFPANAWGLHDMHGNVWEWCLDAWHGSYEGAPTDGSAWMDGQGEQAVERSGPVRGGSWSNHPKECRSASRVRYRPESEFRLFGFRVVCLPQSPSAQPSNH